MSIIKVDLSLLKSSEVPKSCTNRQGKLALVELGKFSLARDYIISISDETEKMKAEIEWESSTWEISNLFLKRLWSEIGGTESELEDAFRLASRF